jgi:hypothetical protein
MRIPGLKYIALLSFCGGLISVTRAANNAPVAPLPTADALLQRVIEQSQKENGNDQAFKERYHYTRTKSTEYRNGSGDLKKKDEKTKINRPKPAPDPVILVSDKTADSGDRAGNSKTNSFDKKELLMSTNLLNRFSFTVTGREIVDGRPALIVDFKPKSKNLPEPTLKDRFINKAAGRVWVDEAEAVLVKANVYLTEKVTLFGGIVGAVHKFTGSFGRKRTEDGLWFTSLAKWHLEAREVVLNRTIDFEEKKTDVRKAW